MAKVKRKHSQQGINSKAIYTILALLLLGVLWLILGNPILNYDFSLPTDINKFKIYNTSISQEDTSGIKFDKIKNTAILFNTQSQLSNLSWDKSPYVKLNVKPENFIRNIILFWSPTKNLNKIYQRFVHIPSNQSSVIINVAQNLIWQRTFPWQNDVYGNTNINAFGLLIPEQYSNSFTILKIELLTSLNLLDYIKLIVQELLVDEGVRVNSINAQYGISILGVQLSYLLGIILILLAIPILHSFNRINITLFTIGAIACLALYSIPTMQTLINHAHHISKKSAFYVNKYEEYESRFGEKFAKLAQAFENKVPYGSKVYFPKSKDYQVQGESNWIEFQYYGLYKISNIANANYIFYYYPEYLRFDNAKKLVTKYNKKYKFEAIANINNNYILKKWNKK